MESNKGCSTIKTKKSSYIFFNQYFVHQKYLLGIDSVKEIAPKEWFNHSKGIDHPFQKKLKLARNEAIQRVLLYCNELYKDYKMEKLAIAHGLCSDADDSSK